MKDVIVVIDNTVVRVPKKVWAIIQACAGQIITNGDHYDYYEGNVPKKTLNQVKEFHQKLHA